MPNDADKELDPPDDCSPAMLKVRQTRLLKGNQLRHLPLASEPHETAQLVDRGALVLRHGVTFDGQFLFMTLCGSNTVEKVRLSDGRVVATSSADTSRTPTLRQLSASAKLGQLEWPAGTALSPDGLRIFVIDAGGHRVVVYRSSNLRFVTSFGAGHLRYPEGCCSHVSRLYVADCMNHRIAVFDFDGALRASYGARGQRPGDFESPCDVKVARDRLVVIDTRRIQVLSLDGVPQQVLCSSVFHPDSSTSIPRGPFLVGICGLCVHDDSVLVTDEFARMLHVLRLRPCRHATAEEVRLRCYHAAEGRKVARL